MTILGFRSFSTELIKIATEALDADIRANVSEAKGKEYLYGGQLRTNTEIETNFKPKLAGFMAFTPVGTYNVLGNKKREAQPSSSYERLSGTAGTALRGGMTGAGVATLGHALLRGHEAKLAPGSLGKAVAIGGGIAIADRALRRRAVKKQLEKAANLATSFSPARQLHANQDRGRFENKVHNTPLKAQAGLIGKDFRLPTEGK
jgi:hypothetical protein